ncbi:MAG TPA: hypothetical protein VFF69_07050 [Phycisphaerales bacterium]|nr:hypothetical protein [Phycisphaerales bacterium]
MLRSCPSLRIASARPLAWLIVAAALALFAPARSLAQTAAVEPYFAVTTRADVPLKSGDMDGYYHVALLPEGQVLQVDAEGAGWARVAYPPGTPVYVAAAEARLEPGGAEAVLAKVSALKSRNASAGFAQSWQRAVPRGAELPIGTRLRVIEPVTGADGAPIGYLVHAPKEVRGYVKADALRVATDAEVQRYLAALPQEQQPTAEETEPETTPAETPPVDTPPTDATPTPAAGDPAEPGAEDATPAQPETDDSLLGDMTPADEQPEGAQPGAEQPGAETHQPAPAPEEDVTVIHQGEAPSERQLGSLQQLSEAFAEVQGQPSESAELDELAAEFRRTMASLGDDAASQRIRQGLQGRLEFIETRIWFRDRARALREKRDAIDASAQAVTSRVQELERTRGYQFVGRLVSSSVYDGDRLPLMYRIVSVNESMPRTIGYIKPGAADVETATKLGEIVGVLGTSELDEALQLRIVTPTRIDVLQAESVGSVEPAPAAEIPESDG